MQDVIKKICGLMNFMKLQILFWLINFSAPASLQAQQIKGVIKGVVKNEKSLSVESATVSLLKAKDSSLVKGALCNSYGFFSINNIPEGTYLLSVSAAGHKKQFTNQISINNLTGHAEMNITITSLAVNLREVKVSAQRPLIEQEIDRTILNVENSILAAGNNTLELLENAPMVTVDQDGNIAINGRGGILVLIDNRPTNLSAVDVANLLRSMPASQIAKLEIITNPPAKYDAAGVSGIINIRMKKNPGEGLNGSYTGSFQQGRLPRLLNAINLNYRKKKWNMFGNLSYSKDERWNTENTVTDFFANGTISSKFL